jgi:hypothetical protein
VGEERILYYRLMFLGNKKQGVKREKENLDDLSQAKVKRSRLDEEAESKERKEKKRKHEQKDKHVSQVSLIHNTVNKD